MKSPALVPGCASAEDEPVADIRDWLLEGDPSVRWRALHHLDGADQRLVVAERARVADEGWGACLLAEQSEDGTWGGGLYSP